jgi:hypothetical protein
MTLQIQEITLPLDTIQSNVNNPRKITDEKLASLVKSIQDLPAMLDLRPLIINEDNIILAGNMRYKALQSLGYTEVKVTKVIGLTKDQENDLLLKDNMSYGDWNWQALLTDDYDLETLYDWGLEIPEWVENPDILEMDDKYMDRLFAPDSTNLKNINLHFNESDYTKVMDGLNKLNNNTSVAVMQLLNEDGVS